MPFKNSTHDHINGYLFKTDKKVREGDFVKKADHDFDKLSKIKAEDESA